MFFSFLIQSYDFFEKRTNKNQIIFIKSRKILKKHEKGQNIGQIRKKIAR